MKKDNTCNVIVALFCMAFTSHIVSAQTWNVQLTGSGKFEVAIRPGQIMENVDVLLLLTHQDNKKQNISVPFTDDQHKFLRPGHTYRKTYNCANSVRRVEGRDTYFDFDVAGGGDQEDHTRPRLGPSSSAPLRGQRVITLRERPYETVLVVRPMAFRGWEQVPGGEMTDEAPAVCEVSNTIYLFSKGINDRGIYMNINSAGTWTGATLIPGMTTNTSLAAVYFARRIFLFARSEDNHCFFTSSPAPVRNNSEWQAWQEIPGNIRIGLPVHASVISNYLYLFTKNSDNNLLSYNRYSSLDAWRGWATAPANFTTNVGITSCIDPGQNRLWLFAKDPNNKIYYNALTVNSRGSVFWANYWQPHPVVGSTVGALTATSDAKRIYLFARGTSNRVFHSQFRPDHDKWTNWREISNDRPTDKDIVITGRESSRFILFCKGITSNRISMNRCQ